MADRPNVLILMCDQMRGDVVDPASPCKTPNFDRYLLQRGSRITRGYTPNAICSPARASFMTGLLPHNHGVLTVTHCVDPDQSVLRTDKPHWAQRLRDAGYHTGYFGKWHVERSGDITPFGWNVDGHDHSDRFKQYVEKYGGGRPRPRQGQARAQARDHRPARLRLRPALRGDGEAGRAAVPRHRHADDA